MSDREILTKKLSTLFYLARLDRVQPKTDYSKEWSAMRQTTYQKRMRAKQRRN